MPSTTVKATLVKISTAEILQFHFNPKTLNAAITAKYGKAASLGGTGERMHFGYTGNFVISTDINMDRHARY